MLTNCPGQSPFWPGHFVCAASAPGITDDAKPREKQKKPEPTEKEQSERFEQMAEEVESDEDPSPVEPVSKKKSPAKRRKTKKPDATN
jgi:hypothetical protein